MEPLERMRIAHGVSKLPKGSLITTNTLSDLSTMTSLPAPLELIDRLVQWLAETVKPGHVVLFSGELQHVALGAESASAAMWAATQALSAKLVSGTFVATDQRVAITLTADGWRRYAELMRDGAGSRHAFMAMKFGVPEMDTIYRDHMKLAVAMTGFELRRTDEAHKSAGLIDNRMRVEIRTSRFLVCDLSHGNQGAYWEAGYAEGLGRPVIYTCSREAFDSIDARRPHFDTAHQSIIVWDQSDPAPAMQELKDMIRATLPAEAKLED